MTTFSTNHILYQSVSLDITDGYILPHVEFPVSSKSPSWQLVQVALCRVFILTSILVAFAVLWESSFSIFRLFLSKTSTKLLKMKQAIMYYYEEPLITTLQSNTVIIQVSHDKVSVKLDRLRYVKFMLYLAYYNRKIGWCGVWSPLLERTKPSSLGYMMVYNDSPHPKPQVPTMSL